MPSYIPSLVEITGSPPQSVEGAGSMFGFAVPFRYLLLSYWLCLGQDGVARTITVSGGDSFFTLQNTGPTTGFHLDLSSGLAPPWWISQHAYSFGGYVTNVLLSVDSNPAAPIVQLYANDIAVPMSAGGLTGSPPPGNFSFGTTTVDFLMNTSAPPHHGLGDVFIAAPTAFFDLSVTVNRRRFINADLTAVDPGSNGSEPLGVQPPVYLTGRSGTANGFAANNGTGGAFTIHNGPLAFMPGGTCAIPPPPVGPGPGGGGGLAMDNVVALDLTPANISGSQIFLMWSDDRGHSYGSPVGQPIGRPGAYLTSPQWQRLGYARDRVFKLEWSVPVATALQGAFIDVDAQAKS